MEQLDLLSGEPFIFGDLSVKHPTLKEIKDYGEKNYYDAINVFILSPLDLMVSLYDSGIDYEKMDNYELFIMLCDCDPKSIRHIEWLTGISDFKLMAEKETNTPLLFSKSEQLVIDETVYSLIRGFMFKINYINDKPKYNPGDKTTKRAIIEEERASMKRKAKKGFKSILGSQISALSWGNSNGINCTNIWDLHIYQLFDGLFRIDKIKNYEQTMTGYFSGNIDSKNLKKIQSKLNWMS